MVMQVFIDESYSQNGTFILGGYLASAEAWAEFSREWETLLPTARRGNSGKHRFKMNEMAQDGYMESVEPFYRVIEKYASASMWCGMETGMIGRALNRIWVESGKILWQDNDGEYDFAFYNLLDVFHLKRLEAGEIFEKITAGQEVDFYFDDHSMKKVIRAGWDTFLRNRPEETIGLYGAEPRFENDEVFLPLQAADFFSWWVRKGHETGRLDQVLHGDFGLWKENRRIPGLGWWYDEDMLVASLIDWLRRGSIGWSEPIYDAKYHPRPEPAPPSNRPSLAARAKSLLASWKRGRS